MKNLFDDYLQSISSKFAHEETSEMGYRTDFEVLLKRIFETINVRRIDHDPKAKLHNKPDFIVINDDVPILYIEAKDIGVSLDKIEKSEQMTRYYGYTNLVLSDYVEFRFYRNGIKYGEPIRIANYNLRNRIITPCTENFTNLAKTLVDFTQSQKEPIRSGEHLSKIMAGKARRIRDNLRQFLDTESDRNIEIFKVYETIKKLLVHDLSKEAFADMYAQTLVYGLFAARHEDESQSTFSRQEARDLIPKSNPFLRDFFDHIVGPSFDKRLEYIVNELCEVFSHANVSELMREYYKTDLWGKTHSEPDPVIHFYEDFLKEYDPNLRKKMGAYYTPVPIVQFIVRSVDHLLKKEFGLAGGLSDTTKTAKGLHRVQILDPAVGTGTFISKVIRNIYEYLLKTGQKGRWHPYVLHDLLPRLYGFELMMTPYTIAHLKLSLAFRETGFKYFNDRRLGIYLTNSLEEGSNQQEMFALGLAESIAEESREAAVIKDKTPIMVVIGNPPYSGVSSNETPYANNLVERYKVEPGGKQKLQERKHWLNDDYVKFIAMAESMIEKTGDGILAMITNNGYLDNPTFRGMRWHLAKTFDKIYVYDLHGSAKKHEVSSDGSKDENVFDIMQGVGIILAIKTGKKRKDELAEVHHADLYGTRKHKFEELAKTPKWQKLTLDSKMFYFLPKGNKGEAEYNQGISVEELFLKNTTGIVTGIDRLSIFFSEKELEKKTQSIINAVDPYNEFNIRDGRKYKKEERLEELKGAANDPPTRLSYRPFDHRYMYYTRKSECWINSPRWEIMQNYLVGENFGLLTTKYVRDQSYQHVFITKFISEVIYLSGTTATNAINFPLYLYNKEGTRAPNLNEEVVSKIESVAGEVTPEDVFDYVYAVLHSPNYRERYKELLKIDFPRVPYPKDKDSFNELVNLGRELRGLHLLESPKVNNFITTYPETGSDTIDKPIYRNGRVYINDTQYFGNVPESAWVFRIGGYQPAQKWLKDRKNRQLTNEEIEHYQQMIVALVETDELMKHIDTVLKQQ